MQCLRVTHMIDSGMVRRSAVSTHVRLQPDLSSPARLAHSDLRYAGLRAWVMLPCLFSVIISSYNS